MNARWIRAGSIGMISLLCGIGCWSERSAQQARPRSARDLPRTADEATVSSTIYPYSLIPGGVQTSSDFARKRTGERVLAEHYRGIGAPVTPVSFHRDQWMYASYRVADGIYWTKNRVLVHAGENLFTDGKNVIRARCGNRLSERPQVPVSRFEPPAVTTDRFTTEIAIVEPPDLVPHPEVPLIPDRPILMLPVGPATAQPPDIPMVPVSPISPIGGGGGGGEVLHPTPPVPNLPVTPVSPSLPFVTPPVSPVTAIPEASTSILLLAGLTVLVAVRRRRIVAKDEDP